MPSLRQEVPEPAQDSALLLGRLPAAGLPDSRRQVVRQPLPAEKEWFDHYRKCQTCWDLDSSRCSDGEPLWRQFMHERGYSDADMAALQADGYV